MITQLATVNGHVLKLTDRTNTNSALELPTGSVAVDAISFTFTGDDWTNATTTKAVFWQKDAEIYSADITNNVAVIPTQILAAKGLVKFAVYGERGADSTFARVTTNAINIQMIQGAYTSDNAPEPSPSMFEQAVVAGVQAVIDEQQSASATAALAAAEAANNAAKLVNDRVNYVMPSNWHNKETDTTGYALKADGTTSTNSSRFYTDYIPVNAGDIVRSYRSDTGASAYMYNVCCYNESKAVMSGGSDSSRYSFTVPAGCAYVRVTSANSIRTSFKVTRNSTDSSPSTYFVPYATIATDFVTDASATAIAKIINKAMTANDMANGLGCALSPAWRLRMTKGIAETWYKSNLVMTPYQDVYVKPDTSINNPVMHSDRIEWRNTSVVSATNHFVWEVYDGNFAMIDTNVDESHQYGRPRRIVTESLSDCTALVLGDSTVAFGTMTQAMLDYFTNKNKTLTLIGTRGTAPNLHEGRAGAKAVEYATMATVADGAYTNPFYNSETGSFDFGTYLRNIDTLPPDFVIIQLGINDLYHADDSAIASTWTALSAIISSIRDAGADIKIIVNLPTPPNSDQDEHIIFLPAYRSRVIRYNRYVMDRLANLSKVRPSYCHLILDPATEIRDNVHPTDAGFVKMAKEVINQINVWQAGE